MLAPVVRIMFIMQNNVDYINNTNNVNNINNTNNINKIIEKFQLWIVIDYFTISNKIESHSKFLFH